MSELDLNAELSAVLAARMQKPGDYPTAVPGFVLHRRDVTNKPENCFNRPILAVTVQGSKRTVVGNEEYRYGAGFSLLAGVDMPNMSYQTEASPERPYLVMSLDIDGGLVAQLAAELPPVRATGKGFKGAEVLPSDPEVLKAFLRLLKLLDQPEAIASLSPLILREIHLRLLLGQHGEALRAINTRGTPSHQVFRSINWLRENFHAALDTEKLAERANMSPPNFRKHFKTVTTMSPTQYHKRLRLYEAQRLMLENRKNVADAGYAVGYENPSQFSKEYRRLFGTPPLASIQAIMPREVASARKECQSASESGPGSASPK